MKNSFNLTHRGFAIVAVAFSLLAGAVSHAQASDVVRIGLGGAWPGYGIWYLIKAKNLAPDLDIEPSILEDPLQVQAMLAAGSFDVVDSTFDYLPIAIERKLPLKVVAVQNLSHGGDQIVVAAGLKIPQDIKGQPLPASFGYLGQLVAAFWLNKIGLGVHDVKFEDLTVDQATPEMISGKVKAAYMYEPDTSQVLNQLKGSRIAFSTTDPEWMKNPMGGDALTMSDSFITKHRAVALKVLEAYWAGEAYWRAHPAESNAIIAKALQYSVPDVVSVMGSNGSGTDGQILVGSFLFSAQFCGVAPGIPYPGEQNGQIYLSLAEINKWWIKLGQMQTTVSPKAAADCSLIGDLVKSGFQGVKS
jgi:NitT/TauT family transport system substrate-binding protein